VVTVDSVDNHITEKLIMWSCFFVCVYWI